MSGSCCQSRPVIYRGREGRPTGWAGPEAAERPGCTALPCGSMLYGPASGCCRQSCSHRGALLAAMTPSLAVLESGGARSPRANVLLGRRQHQRFFATSGTDSGASVSAGAHMLPRPQTACAANAGAAACRGPVGPAGAATSLQAQLAQRGLGVPRVLPHTRRLRRGVPAICGARAAGPAVLLLRVLEDGPVKHVVPREACGAGAGVKWRGAAGRFGSAHCSKTALFAGLPAVWQRAAAFPM